MLVPAAVQPAVMLVKLGARPAIVVAVAIIVPTASDAEANALCARDCRRGNREGRQRGENARKFLHGASPIVVARRENDWAIAAFRKLRRNFLERIFRLVAHSERCSDEQISGRLRR